MASEPEPSRIFLSHATEDKPRVLQVYAQILLKYPEISSWIDMFEILAGDSLIDKIAEGMDRADRFFIFLSPISITKPWVQAELKRALNHEINGIKPRFVVPVKFGGLDHVPPFLEDKKYIDLDKLTLDEWLTEVKASIDGTVTNKNVAAAPNLLISAVVNPQPGMSHEGQVAFAVRSWAEEISFAVDITTPVAHLGASWEGPGAFRGAHTFSEMLSPTRVGYAMPGRRLSPGQLFRLTLRFPEGTSFTENIRTPSLWDGNGHTTSGMRF
ncbi:toll/interleukin-1 receptor domain-containing protein [Pseudarthrobacter sp. CCNWLW207]|uniref:toll/interleukin-1 receptor domain-containing protein n=1 Tax=Pseudarthrobacter sp. CCNWLW207 TaxID=3127468 RepID=UPI003077B749